LLRFNLSAKGYSFILDGAEYARGYIQHWLRGQKEIPNHNAARIFTAASTILKARNPAARTQ
jgi:hypothetical protein